VLFRSQDAQQRLACFDREIALTRKSAATAAPAAPSPAQVPVPAASRESRSTRPAAPASSAQISAPVPAPAPTAATRAAPSFGEEQLSPKDRPTASEDPQALHARIASLREVEPSTYLVTLDNGQAWRHEDSRLGPYLREGEAITISKGSLGTYRLTRDDGQSRNWIRVKRVR
jgi:hypothetical protein